MDSQYPVYSFPYSTCFSCLVAFDFLFLISIILVCLLLLSFALYFYKLILNDLLTWLLYGPPERSRNSGETISLFRNIVAPSFQAATSSQTSTHGNMTLLQTFSMGVFERLREMEERERREQVFKMLPAPVEFTRDETSSLDECVICLENFHDGESCRTFSHCRHIFHLSCIDKWLSNHVTCPICRDYVIDIPEV